MSIRKVIPNVLCCRLFVLLGLLAICGLRSAEAKDVGKDITDQLSADASVDEIVDHLYQARKTGSMTRAVALHFPDLDRETAYKIQFALLARLEAAGERLAGWKMGGTKIVKPEDKLDPIFGFMLTSDEYKSGSTVEASQFADATPIMEAEVGFWIDKDLPGPKVSREQLKAAIGGVGGASEIISVRLRDAKGGIDTGVDLALADGLSHGGFILPKKHVPLAEANLDEETGQVEINGQVIAEGAAKTMMNGAPLDAVLALANLLPKHGRHLRAGEVVIIGSMLDSPPATVGDKVKINFSTFEPLSINFK